MNDLEARIVQLLVNEPDGLSGYQILKLLEANTDHWSLIGNGTLFAALDRLAKSGELTRDWIPGPYPRQRCYRLSAVRAF